MLISLAVIWSVRLPGIAFEQNTYGFSIHSQLDRERRAGILGNFLQAGASALEVFLCRQKCCCTIYLPTDNLGLGCLRTSLAGLGPPTQPLQHALPIFPHFCSTLRTIFAIFCGPFLVATMQVWAWRSLSLSLGLRPACTHGGGGCHCTTLKCDSLDLRNSGPEPTSKLPGIRFNSWATRCNPGSILSETLPPIRNPPPSHSH